MTSTYVIQTEIEVLNLITTMDEMISALEHVREVQGPQTRDTNDCLGMLQVNAIVLSRRLSRLDTLISKVRLMS